MLRTMNRGLLFSCFPCGISRSQEPGWLPRKGPRRLADNGAFTPHSAFPWTPQERCYFFGTSGSAANDINGDGIGNDFNSIQTTLGERFMDSRVVLLSFRFG